MANTVSSIDASLLNLAPTFQKAIKAIIESESTPLRRTQNQRDQLDIRRGVYADVKSNFDALQSAMQALISTQASFGLKLVSKASVTPSTAGTTVLTANLTDDSALTGEYDFSVTRLAKAESRAAAPVVSPDVALNKSGAFWMGGTGIADLDLTPTGSVIAGATSSAAGGQRELGEGNYTLQFRDLNGIRQFRMVDADGNAVSIRNTDGSSTYTADWQKAADGSYDTGRGQIFTMSSAGGLESATFHYTAKGVSISIGAADTLRTIAAAINALPQPEGRDFSASIVANQLVLTGAQTGVNHALIFNDGANLGFDTLLQSAQNAQFTINGMNVSAARNNNLADIVDGATISLAGDAEGRSARLSVNASADKAAALVNAMVSKFNAALTHLKDKLASTAKTDGDKTTYTRGPLTGDVTFNALRADLFHRMNRSYDNSGSYRRFEEIGLSFDKDLKLTFDNAKFGEAFRNRTADVNALLDAGMGAINSLLSRYTGSNGILSRSLNSIENQRKAYDQRIEKYNNSLAMRKQALYTQYMEYQNQLADLGRTAQMFGINLGSNVDALG